LGVGGLVLADTNSPNLGVAVHSVCTHVRAVSHWCKQSHQRALLLARGRACRALQPASRKKKKRRGGRGWAAQQAPPVATEERSSLHGMRDARRSTLQVTPAHVELLNCGASTQHVLITVKVRAWTPLRQEAHASRCPTAPMPTRSTRI